jgi:outer membrane protein TolC
MSHARAQGQLISLVAFCWTLTVPMSAQAPLASTRQGSVTIDLKNALERARENSPQLQSATLSVELAREDRSQARASFLPSLNSFNQYLYTQGNGTPSGIFVANDGVHVYSSQAVVHQELYSPGRLAEYRRTAAAQALVEARKDIVARGLVSTVIQDYYAAVVAQRRHANSLQALSDARHLVEITEALEAGGEVAHSDVVKARLIWQQGQRDSDEARLTVDRARVALAVLLFPDYRDDFTLVDDLDSANPLPSFDDLQAPARETSPELRAAEEGVRQEQSGVAIARSAYLPSLSFDYFFGINANQFAAHDPEGNNRLGSMAQASLTIPVWNWSATKSRVRQADLRRRQAQLDLVLTERQIMANLRSSYFEAQGALAQLDSLRRSLELSRESLRLTDLRYQAGEVTVLEMTDAHATLVQARNAYDDGLARYRLAFANLQTLIGNY